jgi:hypothetical protein
MSIQHARETYVRNRARWLLSREGLTDRGLTDWESRHFIREMEQAMTQMIGSFTYALRAEGKRPEDANVRNLIGRDLAKHMVRLGTLQRYR